MNILMYDNLEIEKIKFGSKPYKKIKTIDTVNGPVVKSVYYIDMSYENYKIYVQIPRYKLTSVCLGDQLMTLVVDKYFYYNFIRELEDRVINAVYKNSEQWFGGKRFTIDKITNCIVTNAERLENDDYIFTVSISKGLRIYDQFRKAVSIERFVEILCEQYIEIVPILCIENLQFIDNRFLCNITVEQIKFYTDKPLLEYTILSENHTTTNTGISEGMNEGISERISERISEGISERISERILNEQTSNIGTSKKRTSNVENSEGSILEDEYYRGDDEIL